MLEALLSTSAAGPSAAVVGALALSKGDSAMPSLGGDAAAVSEGAGALAVFVEAGALALGVGGEALACCGDCAVGVWDSRPTGMMGLVTLRMEML